MTRLTLIVAIVLTAILRPASAVPPNVVLIYADDLGYGDISNPDPVAPKTPNIDRLAKGGLVFTDGHCSSSTCTPSRYAMLTGRYAFREPKAQILPGDAPALIRPGTATVASVLRSAGYATACIGKWHLGLGDGRIDWNGEVQPGPMEVGFDESFIIPATPDRVPCAYLNGRRIFQLDPADPITVDYHHKVGDLPTGRDHPELLRYGLTAGHADTIIDHISRIGFMAGGRSAWWTDETMSDVLATRAEAFLAAQRAGKPFFLYFATNGIHVPRAPSAKFLHSSRTGLRGDTIQELDWVVGRVIDALDRLRLADETLVILSSDNGPVLDDGYADGAVKDSHGLKPAGPWRGGKYSIYEGGTRVPFITRWPGRIRPGTSAALVCQVDLLASLAKLANAPLPADAGPDSQDLSPALLGDRPAGRDHLVEQSSTLAIRQANWKFIPPGPRRRLPKLEDGDATEGPKLTPAGQLFDLATDPGETKNCIADHPDIANHLADLLQHDRTTPATR